MRRKKPHTGTAVNRRDAFYKYFPVDDVKSIAVPARRCKRSGRITTSYCVVCHQPLIEKYLMDGVCEVCKGKRSKDYIG
ncbi:hypothetical protein H6504_05065 [Candidatus Woesearchaeota archaeon]|nr:hypothetical protein [Candidatus Woesearchaeota archaeon]